MTNDLVESMIGHRTRLIQEEPRHWHDSEDQALERYLRLSEGLDQIGMQNSAIVSRGWIIVGLTGLAVAFVASSPSPSELAIGLGGILLAAQGLGKLANGAQSLVSLLLAWGQVGPLFNAASRKRDLPDLSFVPPYQATAPADHNQPLARAQYSGNQPLLTARDVVFRYRPQGRPVLQDCSLQIYPGDRILLEGPSGGGKTTLGAVLTGLRNPESGSLMLWGYDRKILGSEEWRRRVVMAPQFQENYVFSDTLAFNLLMGRRWPPTAEDLADAEAICAELGLSELIERMPSGLQQMLGESGWQLSHGERSRLFIARALLQASDMLILDESFGALDPENLGRSISCVLNRAASVLVIAHP
jgi:ATP-binding cassette subfamily B protein